MKLVNKMENKKVACIVVTYNRLSLLKNAIYALKKQSYENRTVFVVNNGSTDGTKEWLDTQTDMIVINQENLGGAGGFYAGMKEAFDRGYEWIWLQDDDGEADTKQLEKLIAGAERLNSKFVNALVCCIDNPDLLSFGLNCEGKAISTVSEAEKFSELYNAICPFNGTLIHRDIIQNIGLVKREMFIWGDEVEYTNRVRKAGYKLYTITDAIHLHPKSRVSVSYIIPFVKVFGIIVPPANRRKIFFRNMGYNSRYAKSRGKLFNYMLYFAYFLIRLNIVGLADFVSFYSKGIKDDYSDKV